MTPTGRFSVTPLPAVDDTTPPRATVALDGQPTASTLRGAVLEAALDCGNGFLLILSDDVPWEEGLNVHLLDRELRLRDSLWMGWPYTPGLFGGLTLHAPGALEFQFPGDTRWRLTILPSRKRALPLPDWMPGIARPATWWRWLELTQLTR